MNEVLGVNSSEILRGGDFMKKILFILLSFGLAAELEVDGDLKVTGTIESVTIDSLQQQINSLLLLIADLELRIANMEC